MRHQILVRSFVLVVAIVVAGSQAAAEGQGRDRGSQERDGGSEGQDRGSRQGAAAGLVVPIVGTTSAGGTFSGTLTVQRFIARGGNIFAVGLVTGAVTVPGQPVGTLLNGPKEIPVIVSLGTSAGLAPSSSMIRPVGGLGRHLAASFSSRLNRPAASCISISARQRSTRWGLPSPQVRSRSTSRATRAVCSATSCARPSACSTVSSTSPGTAEALTGLLEAAHRRFALAGARRQKTPVSCRLFLSVPVRHGIQMLTPG